MSNDEQTRLEDVHLLAIVHHELRSNSQALKEFQFILKKLAACYMQKKRLSFRAVLLTHYEGVEELSVYPLHLTTEEDTVRMLEAASQAYMLAMMNEDQMTRH